MPTSTLTKWGNSQGIIVPKSVCEELHLGVGDKLELEVVGDELHIRRSKSYTIQALLSDYEGPGPDHTDFWGPPVGKEMW